MSFRAPLHWLLVDLNSYFASVEQQLNPRLRGKPIAVVPMKVDSTFCIAASYPAKAFGVKTGVRVGDAKKMCPGLILVEARHNAYIEYHEKIVAAIETCHPVTTVLSIDEVALRLGGRDQKYEHAVKLAHEIKQKILTVGSELTSSVGIAPNRFLAKVASDMQKPDGLTVLFKEDLPGSLVNLKLRDLPGVGPAMEKRLYRQGIRTMEQLLALSSADMRRVWNGVWGERMYQWLRGVDFNLAESQQHSISQSHVLPPELRNEAGAYGVAQKLIQKAAMRLRKNNFWTSSMNLYVRFTDRTHWSESLRMMECQDTLTLLENMRTLWARKPAGKPMQVAIAFMDLIPGLERTFSLFEDTRRIKLSQALDNLNVKYGRDTIYFGGIHEVKASAPTRIAFANIPDKDD